MTQQPFTQHNPEYDVFDLLATRTALVVIANLMHSPAERRSPLALAAAGGLLELWDAATPETRRILLLQAAWEARGRFTGEAEDDAARYAGYLAAAAATAAEDGAHDRSHFTHAHSPHFSVASSLAFDRDDLKTSLATALLLAAHIPGDWK
ncbi:hypothetical protein ABTX82_28305 [Streptomyces lavendulae]|uniref:hypothetical protein n=1 Tax=Streptomyces lavendulae TaxID=1914 RepID=UPI003316F7C9